MLKKLGGKNLKKKGKYSLAAIFSVILAVVAILLGSLLIFKSKELSPSPKTKGNIVKENKGEIKVSIIIPVYKVEKYLDECIKSVQKQTFGDYIEVICIDDGSPDRCGAMLDEYAKNDKRIKVIHQKNAGVSSARNAGIEASRGEYIKFLDSDDTIEPKTCEVSYQRAKKEDADILFHDMGQDQILKTPVFDMFSDASWRGLFRRSFINKYKIRFKEDLKYAEDQTFNFLAFPRSNKIVFIKDKFYNYRQHPESAVHTAKLDVHSRCHAKAASYIYEDWKKSGYFQDDVVKIKFLNWWLGLNYWQDNSKINKLFVDAIGPELLSSRTLSLLGKDFRNRVDKVLLSATNLSQNKAA